MPSSIAITKGNPWHLLKILTCPWSHNDLFQLFLKSSEAKEKSKMLCSSFIFSSLWSTAFSFCLFLCLSIFMASCPLYVRLEIWGEIWLCSFVVKIVMVHPNSLSITICMFLRMRSLGRYSLSSSELYMKIMSDGNLPFYWSTYSWCAREYMPPN